MVSFLMNIPPLINRILPDMAYFSTSGICVEPNLHRDRATAAHQPATAGVSTLKDMICGLTGYMTTERETLRAIQRGLHNGLTSDSAHRLCEPGAWY